MLLHRTHFNFVFINDLEVEYRSYDLYENIKSIKGISNELCDNIKLDRGEMLK